MRRLLARRVERLERKNADAPRTRCVFLKDGETVDAHRNRMIANGEASPSDRFIGFCWKPKQRDGCSVEPDPTPSSHPA
jgi:hypothetical protein